MRAIASSSFLIAMLVAVTNLSKADEKDDLRLNELQYIGTHNSYHIEPDAAVQNLMREVGYQEGEKWNWQSLTRALAYTHPPLEVQLQLGIRNFELDVHADTVGGRYSSPGALVAADKRGHQPAAPFDISGDLSKPGFKVFHKADMDVGSTCLVFKECLRRIKNWSDRNPRHIPVIVLIEAKESNEPPITDDYESVVPEEFTDQTWTSFEDEILSVFPVEQIITPDSVRGEHKTLRKAVKTVGWPRVSHVLGKVMFIVMHSGRATDVYVKDNPTLKGRLMFANLPPTHPSASFILTTKPHKEKQFREIQRYASTGYIVFTRGDANTEEARRNDLSRSSYAFKSGAQIVSTDYPYPDYRFSDYKVQFGDGVFVRCNPEVAPKTCK